MWKVRRKFASSDVLVEIGGRGVVGGGEGKRLLANWKTLHF